MKILFTALLLAHSIASEYFIAFEEIVKPSW